MILFNNATKFFKTKNGRKYILRDVSLEIPDNKNIAVLGNNGAGKSTLLRIIGGVEKLNSGYYEKTGSISWPLGLSVGFQGSLTARENIKFVCNINALNTSETAYIMEEVESFCDIGEFFDEPVKTYSNGMRARLAFGLSISFDFDTYLIDELTSVGDATFRHRANHAFQNIIRSQSSVFLVSHNMNTLKNNCNAAILLHEGNLQYFDSTKEAISTYNTIIKS